MRPFRIPALLLLIVAMGFVRPTPAVERQRFHTDGEPAAADTILSWQPSLIDTLGLPGRAWPVVPSRRTPAAEDHWRGDFFLSGPDAAVDDLFVHDDALYAGGSFTVIGSQSVRGLARFDGQSWSEIGGGIKGAVFVIGAYAGDLIVGGFFTQAGDSAASNIARWDGQAWHPLGEGMTSSVYSLAVWNGDLIAGGTFGNAGGQQSWRVARWDGEQWHPMGGGFDEIVRSLAVYRGELYAASHYEHSFEGEASPRVVFVSRWDEVKWVPVSSGVLTGTWGMAPGINRLAVVDDRLYATGVKMILSDDAGGDIAWWDGTSWHGVGGRRARWHYEDEYMCSVLPYRNMLILGGCFYGPGDGSSSGIALYDGSQWSSMPGGGVPQDGVGNYWADAMTEFEGDVYVAGSFPWMGDAGARGLARWDGLDWHRVTPLGHGVVGGVALVAHWGDSLVAGGNFYFAGEAKANNIALWNGMRWSALGNGIDGTVLAVAPLSNGLVAAGRFGRAGNVTAKNVAYWDGQSWNALGEGLGPSYVHDLAVYEGFLIAAGRFESSGASAVKFIARWNGANWEPMGSDLNDRVVTLEIFDGDLYAGGAFGGHLAVWKDDHWVTVAGGTDGMAWALQTLGDWLYGAGGFSRVGNVAARGLCRWDGQHLEAVTPPPGTISRLGVYEGGLLAGGRFASASGDTTVFLMKWDGLSWQPFGGGLAHQVLSLDSKGVELAVGGSFKTTGTKPSFGIALWRDVQDPNPPVRFETDQNENGGRVTWELPEGSESVRYNLWMQQQSGGPLTRLTGAPWSGRTSYEYIVLPGPLFDTEYWLEQVQEDGTSVDWFGPVFLTGIVVPVRSVLAAREPTTASVAWNTSSGGDRALFHIWREEAGGERERLTSQALTGQVEYSFVDSEPPVGETSYWVEQIRSNGDHAVWIGPATIPKAEVQIAGPRARRDRQVAIVEWTIASADSSACFHVHRQRQAEERVRLTGSPLKGETAYQYLDQEAPLGPVSYWIEQTLSNDRHVAWHGPLDLDSTNDLWPLREVRVIPNPGAGDFRIYFALPAPANATLSAFDPSGRRAARIFEGRLQPGVQEIAWDGRDEGGSPLSSGVYWIRLHAGSESRQATIVLLR
jgi:trimeric autotransporter adhesin